MATTYERNSILGLGKTRDRNSAGMTMEQKRECNITLLRKAFGELSDSPTLGYYRMLPDKALRAFTNKALQIQGRMMADGFLGLGSVYAAAGSFLVGSVPVGVAFAAAGAVLAVDAVRADRAHRILHNEILDFKNE